MSGLGHHHSRKTKDRVEPRSWRRHTLEEDKLRYSTRYTRKLAEVQALKEVVKRLITLKTTTSGIRVKTCGACLPASGEMLWKGDGYALVWWEGSGAPTVWPASDLDTI